MDQTIAPPQLLIDLPPLIKPQGPRKPKRYLGAPRVWNLDRSPIRLTPVCVDRFLALDHVARSVWEYVLKADLSDLEEEVGARTHGPGRDAVPPRLLLALWLYATLRGVTSARLLSELTASELAFRWLCNDQPVNRTILQQFVVRRAGVIDRLLTEGLVVMVAMGVVSLDRLAQDGMKLRASAGAGSFETREGLEALRQDAAAAVSALREKLGQTEDQGEQKRLERRLEAETARHEKMLGLMARLKEREEEQSQRAKKDRIDPKTKEPKVVRVSTTDPDCRVMKGAAGEVRPGFNVQMMGDQKTGVVICIGIETSGADAGQLAPAQEQMKKRLGVMAKAVLADKGYCSKADIEACHRLGVEVWVPSNVEGQKGELAYEPKKGDTEAHIAWRKRMQTPEGKASYRERQMIERVFAVLRAQGLRQVRVRGIEKVRGVVLLHALANNLRCMFRLMPKVA